MLTKLSNPGNAVLEVGCGAGYLAIELAKRGRTVTGIDVSDRILKVARAHTVNGIEFLRVDGVELPFPTDSFHLVYSIEVFEHLHPDDALKHLREARRILRPGGKLWALTPNRTFKISAGARFGIDATHGEDIHLKEWTYEELVYLLKEGGFRRIRSPWRDQRRHSIPMMPAGVCIGLERLTRANRSLAERFGVHECSLVAH